MVADTQESTSQELTLAPPPPGPSNEGWASAASAIMALRSMGMPIVMRITALGHPPIMVDPRYNAYDGLDLDDLPEDPRLVLVETQAVGPDTRPALELPGFDLDGLMWRIGLLAYPDRHAPWLPQDQRVRLRRWPNVTALRCGIEQVSLVSLLANAPFTAAELADASGQPLADARSVLNAFSLMDLLIAEPVEEAAPAPRTLLARGQTLLSRLRTKFGL